MWNIHAGSVNMLNEMRYGRLSQESIKTFKSLSRPIVYEDGIGPTELFPRREDVDASNMARMSRLDSSTRTYVPFTSPFVCR